MFGGEDVVMLVMDDDDCVQYGDEYCLLKSAGILYLLRSQYEWLPATNVTYQPYGPPLRSDHTII
jgi:hypothetical protein